MLNTSCGISGRRHLVNDLTVVGASAIEFWAKQRYGAAIFLMIVQQTYGGFLNFYPHLHTLVSAGGFRASNIGWIPDLDFSREESRYELMLAWRFALIAYLEAAVTAKVLRSALKAGELMQILEIESRQSWNIFVSRKVPKRIVINHIGRYIRKPPIAQHRLTRVNEREVQYLAKDTRHRCLTTVTYTNREFLDLIMPHIADRYCNSMRYFGLLAPRSKRLLPVVFDLLNQKQKSNPSRLSYAESMMRTFGENPFIGRDGSVLQRIGWIEPTSVT